MEPDDYKRDTQILRNIDAPIGHCRNENSCPYHETINKLIDYIIYLENELKRHPS